MDKDSILLPDPRASLSRSRSRSRSRDSYDSHDSCEFLNLLNHQSKRELFNLNDFAGLKEMGSPPYVVHSSFNDETRNHLKSHNTTLSMIDKIPRMTFDQINQITSAELAKFRLRELYGDKIDIINLRYIDPFQMQDHTMLNRNRGHICIKPIYYDTSNMTDNTYTCSAPMRHTVREWWKMVIDANFRLITMLTPFIECGREKSVSYYPPHIYNEYDIDDFVIVSYEPNYITAVGCKFIDYNYRNITGLEKRDLVVVRLKKNILVDITDVDEVSDHDTDNANTGNTLLVPLGPLGASLTDSSDGFTLSESESSVEYEIVEVLQNITHLHYTKWADHTAITPEILLNLVQVYSQTLEEIVSTSDAANITTNLIHCSAGVGRAGTFYVLSQLIRHITVLSQDSELVPLDTILNVPEFVLMARRCRMYSVQTPDQLNLIYDALEELAIDLEKDSDKDGENE
jgi:protein tyrosine phosphatase